MNVGDWIDAGAAIVQAAAIAIAGVWAYWKFARGRTFHRRAEVEVEAAIVTGMSPPAVKARAIMENTGAARIPLRPRAKRVRVFAYTADDLRNPPQSGCRLASVRVFERHDWLESQEMIRDEALIPLVSPKGPARFAALRVECEVLGRPKHRWLRSDEPSTAWSDNVFIPANLTLNETNERAEEEDMRSREGQTERDDNRGNEWHERQRHVAEEEAEQIEQEDGERHTEGESPDHHEEGQRDVSEDEATRIEEEP